MGSVPCNKNYLLHFFGGGGWVVLGFGEVFLADLLEI